MEAFSEQRRGAFLYTAAFLANVFLIAVALDAIVGLADDLLIHSPDASAFASGRTAISVAVLALTILTLFLVIFVPHLPKRVLLPPLLVQFWLIFGAFPLDWSPSDRSTWVQLGVIQLAAVAAAFLIAKFTTGHWLLAASRLPHKGALVLHTLIAIPVSFVAMVVLVVAVSIGGLIAYVEELSGGYLQFTGQGVQVRETVMRRDGKTVHLIAMVHFGEPSFYQEVYASIPKDALVLAEGVTDREGRLTHGLSYKNAAQALGLETQGILEELMGPAEPAPEDAEGKAQPPESAASPPAPSVEPPQQRARPTVIRADIDISEFREITIRFIGKVGEIYASPTAGEALEKLSTFTSSFTDDDMKIVMEDLVDKRNAKALAEFDKRLGDYETVVIPWGALHMPKLEQSLKDRGFKVQSQRMVTVARYGTIVGALSRQPAAAAR